MLIIRKIENKHYELVEIINDNGYETIEHLLSKLVPSEDHKSQYEGLCYGCWQRFKTAKEWKQWCIEEYGEPAIAGRYIKIRF